MTLWPPLNRFWPPAATTSSGGSLCSGMIELSSAATIADAFASDDYLGAHLVVAAGTYNFDDDVVIAGNRHITFRPGARFEFAAGKKLRTRCSADAAYYDSGSATVTYAEGVYTLSGGNWSTVGVNNAWVLAISGHGQFIPQTVTTTTITPTYAPLADHQISAVNFALFKPVDTLVMDGQLTMTVSGAQSVEFTGLRYADLSGFSLTMDATGYSDAGILAMMNYCYASRLPHIICERYLATTDGHAVIVRAQNNFCCEIRLTANNNSLVAALASGKSLDGLRTLYSGDCDIAATIGHLYAADAGAAYGMAVEGVVLFSCYRCALTGRAWPIRWGGHGSSTARGLVVNGGANNITTGFYSGGETA